MPVPEEQKTAAAPDPGVVLCRFDRGPVVCAVLEVRGDCLRCFLSLSRPRQRLMGCLGMVLQLNEERRQQASIAPKPVSDVARWPRRLPA